MNTEPAADFPNPADAAPASDGRHKPLKSQVMGGYWRVPVLAIVGALVAFSVSFVFQSKYAAVTRLIIHPNDSSYAGTDSGADSAGALNIDITKQQTLGNTLVNLATSDEAVAEVVNRIGVEEVNGTSEAPELSMSSKIQNFLKSGSTGRTPTAEEAALDQIQGSIDAVVLEDSWVMEITALDPDPAQAKLIATTSADVAVEQSAARFRENSVRELEYLNQKVAEARADLAAKEQALAAAQGQLPPDASPAQLLPIETLQNDVDQARTVSTALETRQASVAAIANKPRYDASRLGDAVVSSSPARPMRYLFLLVGGLVGALAGLLLTWFRSIREDESEEESTADVPAGRGDAGGLRRDRVNGGRPNVRFDEVVDVVEAEPVVDVRSPVAGRPGSDAGAPVPSAEHRVAWTRTVPTAPTVSTAPAVPSESAPDTAPSEPTVPSEPAPDTAPAFAVPTRNGDLSTSEAGSIAAALFGRMNDQPSHS